MIAHTSVTPRAIPATFLDALENALTSERRLIDELTQVILRQRRAVGVDDLPAVNDTVFATHRLLIALSEVRKRRRSLTRLFGYDEDAGQETTANVLAGTSAHSAGNVTSQMPAQLQKEHDALRQAARVLSKEIGVNRRLLRRLLDTSLDTSDAGAAVVH